MFDTDSLPLKHGWSGWVKGNTHNLKTTKCQTASRMQMIFYTLKKILTRFPFFREISDCFKRQPETVFFLA